MGHIKSFMQLNENLISLDLTNTGLNEEGIHELMTLIKSANDRKEEEPQLLRNLACLHLTAPDETQGMKKLVSDIKDVLLSSTLESPIKIHDEEQ